MHNYNYYELVITFIIKKLTKQNESLMSVATEHLLLEILNSDLY